jgi:hypothetical protein
MLVHMKIIAVRIPISGKRAFDVMVIVGEPCMLVSGVVQLRMA